MGWPNTSRVPEGLAKPMREVQTHAIPGRGGRLCNVYTSVRLFLVLSVFLSAFQDVLCVVCGISDGLGHYAAPTAVSWLCRCCGPHNHSACTGAAPVQTCTAGRTRSREAYLEGLRAV